MRMDGLRVACPELRHEEALQHLVGDEHGLALLVLPLLFRGEPFVGLLDGHAAHAGQLLDRFGKGGVVVLHHELDGVAAFVARPEAVPGVAGLVHDEGRRALVVERAAALVVAALLLEFGHIPAHDINDVDALEDPVYGSLINHRKLCHTQAAPLSRQSICHRYAT